MNWSLDRINWALAVLIFIGGSCGLLPLSAQAGNVTITNEQTHFEVVIDLSDGAELPDVAEEYYDQLVAAVPDFEALADSYLADLLQYDLADFVPLDYLYQICLQRTEDFKAQVPEEFQEMIQRIGSRFSGGQNNVLGDGRLSLDEAFMLNLLTDVIRVSQCSALSVFGPRSAAGRTITSRNLEWYQGSQNQVARFHALTTLIKGDQSVFMIGFLGCFGALSAINDDKIFAAILDCPTGMPYSSIGKRSYVFDLLYALMNYDTLAAVAGYLADPEKEYAFNHLIFFSDPDTSQVLENNFSGLGTDMHRALRSGESVLNPGLSWGVDNSPRAVNAFMLLGNHDNYTANLSNMNRWADYKSLIQAAGQPVDAEALKPIATHFDGSQSGEIDIYQSVEQQIMIIQPETLSLKIFFRPKEGDLPLAPQFEEVIISFEDGEVVE